MIDLKHLPGGQDGEQVELVLRRHWFELIPLAVSLIVIILLPIAAYLGIRFASPEFFTNQVRTLLFVLFISIFFLFTWMFLYQHYIDYYLDTWIVTNDRILNIEQHGLFARTVSEVRLHRVQDVTAEVHGFIRTMFDYGEVHIQTAGEEKRFVFEDVPHPNAVAKRIGDLAEKERREHLEQAVQEFGMPNK